MRRYLALISLCLASLGLYGCARAVAQSAPLSGFTATSGSQVLDAHTYYVGAEANLPAPGAKADLALKVPAGVRIQRLTGTVSMTAACDAEVLASIAGYPVILKNGRANLFIDYRVPLVSSGNLHVESVSAGCTANWEFQGLVLMGE